MKKILITLLTISAIAIMPGCAKKGCTKSLADNYNDEATLDDFSCVYTGNVYFWCLPAVSDSLNTLGHSILRFELEGQILDSVATISFASVEGVCNAPGVMTIPRTFTGNNEWKYKWRVKGNNFMTVYEGFITIPGGDCVGIQLDYP
ncbi:MAG: hypothetical protein R2780_13525 [Crocinitomicaceae bacterium]|nr:hypothetical protein [Crocinitomicaceae bacterium]